MDLNAVPTKGNLIAAKNSLALAKQGFELMDKKRNILVREIMDLNAKAKDIQNDIDKTFTEAYTALERANIELGIQNVEIFAFNVPLEHDIKIKSRSIFTPTFLAALIFCTLTRSTVFAFSPGVKMLIYCPFLLAGA